MDAPANRTLRLTLSIVVASLALVALVLALLVARKVAAICLIGIGFGVLISPLIDRMQAKWKLPRGLGALLVALAVIAAFGALAWAVLDVLAVQGRALLDQLPTIFESAKATLEHVFARQPWVHDQLKGVELGAAAGAIVGGVLKGVQAGGTALATGILVLTLAIYTALNATAYRDGFLTLFPAWLRPRATEILAASATTLRRWLSGQLLVMAGTGTIVTIALKLVGVKFWLLFGLLAGALDFVPYVGPIIAFGAIALVTLGAQPDRISWVIALFFVVQQIEGQLLMPLVMRERVKLPEVHLLVLMLFLASFLGIPGALLAPPLLAVGRKIYLMTWAEKMDRRRVPPPDASPA